MGTQWLPGPPEPDSGLDEYIAGEGREHSGVYGPKAKHSFFCDLLAIADEQERVSKSLESPILRGKDPGAIPTPGRRGPENELDAVRRRLAWAAETRAQLAPYEKRDLVSANVPAGWPIHLAAEYALAARSQGTLAAALRHVDLPPDGIGEVRVPRIVSGATATVAAEGGNVSEVDPVTNVAASVPTMVSGQVDLSRQLFDRAGGLNQFDTAIAQALGKSIAERVDLEFVLGDGTPPRTRGLESTSGTVGVTYTNASPTGVTTASAIWNAYQTLTGSSGYGTADPGAYLIVVHPRRLAHLNASADAMKSLEPFRGVIASAAVPTTVNSTQDVIYVLDWQQSFVCEGLPSVRVFPEAGSAELQVRISVWAYAASVFGRAPTSIARITGTGLAPPVL